MELPTGTVIAFAANSTPSGYLLCNGATVSRTTYADLFAVIGTTYGTGDGSKTFALPNLTDKFIMGSGTAGTSKEAGLPNIIGAFALQNDKFVSKSGAFTAVTDSTRYTSGINSGGSGQGGVNFNASNSNSIYGKSSTVQPPALTMCFYIKY